MKIFNQAQQLFSIDYNFIGHGDKTQNFYYYLNAAYTNVPNYSPLDFE